MNNRANHADSYTPIYDERLYRGYAEVAPVCTKMGMFQEITDKTKEYKTSEISGTGMWDIAQEGEGGNFVDMVEGYNKTFTQVKYRQDIPITFEAVDHDEYAIMKKAVAAEKMGRGARARIERETSGVLMDAFSVAGPDGQYGFDSDHPQNSEETATTFDNLLTGAFSHDNLDAAETQLAANYIGEDNLPIEAADSPIILHPYALNGAVDRVLSGDARERPGTANRDINRFAGMYRPLNWRYLSISDGGYTGSTTAWYMIYPEQQMLKLIFSQKPNFTNYIDNNLELYIFKGRMLFDCGYTNWRFGLASTGA